MEYDIKIIKDKLYDKFMSSKNPEANERYNHSLGVAKKTLELIEKFDLAIELEKAEVAGLIHDYAKFESLQRYHEIIDKYQLDATLLNNNFSVLHAFLGPYIISEELEIYDKEILDAVRYHTTGYQNMSKLSELIYLADYIEENRDYELNENVRKIANKDYLKAIATQAKYTIKKLTKDNKKIHKYTLEMYEKYKKYLEEDNLENLKKIVESVDDAKVKDIKVYETKNITPLFDYVVIATATSPRQMNAVVDHLKDDSSKKGFMIRGIEGVSGGLWVLVDLQEVLVNIFTEEEREKYALDKMWKDLPQYNYSDLL